MLLVAENVRMDHFESGLFDHQCSWLLNHRPVDLSIIWHSRQLVGCLPWLCRKPWPTGGFMGLSSWPWCTPKSQGVSLLVMLSIWWLVGPFWDKTPILGENSETCWGLLTMMSHNRHNQPWSTVINYPITNHYQPQYQALWTSTKPYQPWLIIKTSFGTTINPLQPFATIMLTVFFLRTIN